MEQPAPTTTPPPSEQTEQQQQQSDKSNVEMSIEELRASVAAYDDKYAKGELKRPALKGDIDEDEAVRLRDAYIYAGYVNELRTRENKELQEKNAAIEKEKTKAEEESKGFRNLGAARTELDIVNQNASGSGSKSWDPQLFAELINGLAGVPDEYRNPLLPGLKMVAAYSNELNTAVQSRKRGRPEDGGDSEHAPPAKKALASYSGSNASMVSKTLGAIPSLASSVASGARTSMSSAPAAAKQEPPKRQLKYSLDPNARVALTPEQEAMTANIWTHR